MIFKHGVDHSCHCGRQGGRGLTRGEVLNPQKSSFSCQGPGSLALCSQELWGLAEHLAPGLGSSLLPLSQG